MLVVLFVYVGVFVLVEVVVIGLIDCIFMCIGVVDDLVGGCFIFMVEMIEVVVILYCVMFNSLVLMDEIGCGMSMFDGLVFVWVIVCYLLLYNCSYMLFVMYYFELM